MRRASLILLAGPMLLGFESTTSAQPFGWFFGGSAKNTNAARRLHHPIQRQFQPQIPLPVPRPTFATDRPPAIASGLSPQPMPEASSSATAIPTVADPTAGTSPPGRALGDNPPTPPPKPADLTKAMASPFPLLLPKVAVAPSGATTAFTPRQPAADASCMDRLKTKQAKVEPVDIGKQPDDRCTVIQAVRLSALSVEGGTLAFPDRPIIACTTADVFTAYVRDLLAPLAKGSFGSPLAAVWTGSGLECRSRDHIFGAKLSSHGQGLAVDIAQLKLADGRVIEVGTPKNDADAAFETAARAGGCGYFHTVLGPGSDTYHRTHWHFDLEVRGRDGDTKFCK